MARSVSSIESPVTLPPGRARLATHIDRFRYWGKHNVFKQASEFAAFMKPKSRIGGCCGRNRAVTRDAEQRYELVPLYFGHLVGPLSATIAQGDRKGFPFSITVR
jgi:hypothetical protein